jgi:branched-chain amino acid transport system substrate-binding protein
LTLLAVLVLVAAQCVAAPPAAAPEQPAAEPEQAGAAPSEAEAEPAGGEVAAGEAGEIKIGINAEITGDIPSVGENCKNAAEMFAEEVNAAGGLDVGGQKYMLTLVIEDDEAKAESAAAANTKLITQDGVLAIIGPNASKQAVPAGEVANANQTPMISPWSTNPATTKDRPWVFRAPFLDDFQGPVVSNFVTEEYGLTKAAVLYDVASDYSKGLAEFFRQAWEEKNGAGSVVAYESFTTGDADFSAQLTKIKSSGTEFLFTPQYYNEVPLIVQQAKELGLDFPIVGSDSWSDPQTLELCGADCEGYFIVAHYIPTGAVGATKEFIDKYNAKYGYVPSDVGALTWDSMALVTQAIQDCGAITGDLATDRQCVRDALAQIKDFEGVTGKMTFTEEGDPIKCAAIAQIKDGQFQFYKQVCP